MRRPAPRGPLSTAIDTTLQGPVRACPSLSAVAREACARRRIDEVTDDEDLQLSLTMLYELHYRGIDGVDPEWEWSGDLIEARRVLERRLEASLRRLTSGVTALVARPRPEADDVARVLFAMVEADDGPSLSAFMDRKATLDQFREFLVHRSIYHLKEADPHTWAVPRLAGRAKAALVEVQADEYGGGRAERMHSVLFARTMAALDLADTYGAYIDDVPATTLAATNAISMFGLHRRLRGAVAGHLAALEMGSSVPNRRYGNGLRRLGFDADTTWFFDEHVEADAVHEQIAGRDLAGGLVEDEPDLLGDVLFGAATALALDARAASRMLEAWAAGRSSLRSIDEAPDRRPPVPQGRTGSRVA